MVSCVSFALGEKLEVSANKIVRASHLGLWNDFNHLAFAIRARYLALRSGIWYFQCAEKEKNM